jgi:hypothetical protein
LCGSQLESSSWHMQRESLWWYLKLDSLCFDIKCVGSYVAMLSGLGLGRFYIGKEQVQSRSF